MSSGPHRKRPLDWDKMRQQDTWMDQGLCNGMDINIFFPEAPDPNEQKRLNEEAKAICANCPVMEQCKQYGIEEKISHGIFGGLTPTERSNIIRGGTRRSRMTPEQKVEEAERQRQRREAKKAFSVA